MDNAKEGFKLVDIGFGVLLLCIVVATCISLFALMSPKADDAVTGLRDEINNSSMQRLQQITTEGGDTLCTVVASIVKDMADYDLSHIAIIGPPDVVSAIYAYESVTIYSPDPSIVHYVKRPTEEAANHLLGYSNRRCHVAFEVDASGYTGIEVTIY